MNKPLRVALGITGSFCTFDRVANIIEGLVDDEINIIPVFSFNAATMDTRFGCAEEWKEKFYNITGNIPITTIQDAEPIGPKKLVDIMVIAPCTGNTLSKLANAITDTPVLMAAKSHLRNGGPLVIGISTNDALGMNAKNIGVLQNTKNYYFIPYSQDNPDGKPTSIIANYELMKQTIEYAMQGKQIQPVVLGSNETLLL